MKTNMLERSAAVLVGMATGYVLWLAGITALTVIVPMQHIIIAAAVFLGLITIISFALANHFKKVREALCRAGLLVRAYATHDSQHLLPYRFSELTRKYPSMMKSDTPFAFSYFVIDCCEVEVRDER